MSDADRSERPAALTEIQDVPSGVDKQPAATSYLPLWFLLAFAAMVACGVLTK